MPGIMQRLKEYPWCRLSLTFTALQHRRIARLLLIAQLSLPGTLLFVIVASLLHLYHFLLYQLIFIKSPFPHSFLHISSLHDIAVCRQVVAKDLAAVMVARAVSQLRQLSPVNLSP